MKSNHELWYIFCQVYREYIAIGAYEVVFYDGFKKTVQPINIKPMPPDVQEQVRKVLCKTYWNREADINTKYHQTLENSVLLLKN